MGTFRDWVRRRRVLAAFAAGVLLTLAAVAIVGYLVLADQRRSARILAATLTQALGREVEIERVTDLGPSRVVLRGLRLPAERGWPAEVKAESVEASGPLLSAARGEAAPVRLLVTRPRIVTGNGGATGAAALEGLRQGLASFIGSAPLVDVAITGGVIQVPGSASEDVTFDATLHKGSGEVRGEVLLRDRARSRFTLGLYARADGDTIRLDLAGEGGLAPLAPWLPAALMDAARTTPIDVRAQLGLSPGDRAAGRASARLGDLVALEGALSFQDRRLRLGELRGTADLGLAGSMAGLAGPVKGHAELADGEVTWAPERGGWPEARATLHVLDASLPASAVGLDVLARGVEARLALGPREGRVSARGDLRGERVEVAGLALAPVATPFRVDFDAGGSFSRVELTGLTAQVLGVPLRGTVAYDVARARADARVETSAVRLDALARHFGGDWLGPSDQLRAGSVRVVVTGLDPRGWTDGKVDAEIRGVALRQPSGEAAVERARVQATVRSGNATIGYEAERVRGALPSFEGLLHRVEGSADIRRDGAGARLARATIVARDAEGREMLQADLGRRAAGSTGPIRLTARVPALERLAPLWPSVPREVTGSATVELESPDMGFGTYEGRLGLQVAMAELLGGRLSLRDVSADVPVRRGGVVPPAGAAADGPFKVGELVGYGAVLYDVTARARAIDQRLTLTDLHYGLYSGEGRGTIELELAAAGPTARARITGERVRIDEFMAAYGIHGGTMTGLLRYDLDMRYGGGRLGADGRFGVPEGGTVTIELLDRLLSWAEADPTGVVRTALGNLRAFDYKAADVVVRTEPNEGMKVTLSLKGREILGIFPPRVKEINVIGMPIGFLAKQFPGL
jgi:hypothetical protein